VSSMTGRKALWARPACDPELPGPLRLLLTQTQVSGPLRRRQQDRELRRHAASVVLPYELDAPSRLLLARAQVAAQTILGSDVRAAGLLQADEPVLRRHEWEIACAVRELNEVRALPAASAGAMTAAVLDSQQRALALAQDSIASRISALERYADQVEAADDAHRDWHTAMRQAGLNDRYLDLVARTAADELAVAELGDLADQAALTVQVLAGSLRDASAAAAVLAFPPGTARAG
jgi:hypothetical protein